MTDGELRTLVGSLALATASNTEANRELRATVENQERVMTEGFARLTATVESQAESIRELRTTVESQERTMTEGFARLTATAESQARNIESMRESVSYNTEILAASAELAASSQRTAAAALELSANTSRNLDRQERDTAEMKQMIGILIRENQADRVRFSRLEGQN
jgi:predicted phage tail protein